MSPDSQVQFLTGKTSAPSEMRTAEWDRVPLYIKERSFFMAGVEDAEILDRFRAEVEKIARGDSTTSQSQLALGDYLKARGYRPKPGQEGTIKDLRNLRRMTVALETNVDMARGYGGWVQAQAALRAFPAWRYIRGRQAMVPRDWPSRWNAARAGSIEAGATEATSESDMVALINHPIWTDPDFNRFGSPYPPYDWRSGMTVRPVSRSEAKELGLLDDYDNPEFQAALRDMMTPRSRSLNDGLQARPAIASGEIREQLAERLRGFAEWDGEVLRFTDPNGTRPGTPDQVAEWITAELPVDPSTKKPFPQLQAEALELFGSDPEGLAKNPALDEWDDLARLLGRILPDDGRDRFLSTLAREGRTLREGLAEMMPPALLSELAKFQPWQNALAIVDATQRARTMLTILQSIVPG